MPKDGTATVANDLQDIWQTDNHCDLVIPDELLPLDLQQLSKVLHVKGLESFDVSGSRSPGFGYIQ